MAISKCPGQDNRNWKSQDAFESPCPSCGKTLEFWKSEPRRRCIHCGKKVLNPQLDLGCAKWCSQASECLGMDISGSREDSLCEAMVRELEKAAGGDRSVVSHALEVLNNAERIMQSETADPLVVKASAILQEIEADAVGEGVVGGAGGRQAPRIVLVRKILTQSLQDFHIDSRRIEQVCSIIQCLKDGQYPDTAEFRIVQDACRLAAMPPEPVAADRQAQEQWVRQTFCTQAAQRLGLQKWAIQKGRRS